TQMGLLAPLVASSLPSGEKETERSMVKSCNRGLPNRATAPAGKGSATSAPAMAPAFSTRASMVRQIGARRCKRYMAAFSQNCSERATLSIPGQARKGGTEILPVGKGHFAVYCRTVL